MTPYRETITRISRRLTTIVKLGMHHHAASDDRIEAAG